jgi:hypothetical protein
MSVYYCDSSILIKYHIDEAGSQWVQTLVEEQDSSLFTTQISLIETCSAPNRRLREQSITASDYRDLMTQCRFLFDSTYNVVEFSAQVSELACRSLERHPLRAIDAIHLAMALILNTLLVDQNESPLTFLSADQRLLTAALAEGLSTFDPSTVSS